MTRAEKAINSLVSHQKRVSDLFSEFSGDKAIRGANELATAIGKVGGASKLTAAEQAHVNRTVTEALAKYKALGIEAPAALTKLANETKQVGQAMTTAAAPTSAFVDHFKGVVAGMLTATAVIGTVRMAVRGLTDFITSSVAAYAQQESAVKKMTTALQAQGNATPAVVGQYKAMASQFQNTTVFADELINEMQALLVQVGNVMPSQMKGALQTATDLASGLGVDPRTATMLVGKAFEGETGTLKRYGIVIDEAKLKTEGVTAVMDAIQSKFGGQAQSEIETYAGKVKQLANSWDELKEAVGRSIVDDPILMAGVREITNRVKAAGEEADKARPSFLELWGTVANVGPASIKVIQLAEDLTDLYNVVKKAPKPPDLFKLFQSDLKPKFGNVPTFEELDDEEGLKRATDAIEQHRQAVQSLLDTYTGKTVIDQARRSVETITKATKIGIPVMKMTVDQQLAIHQTISEAIEVFRAHGQVAPQAMRDLYIATFP